MSEMQIAEIVEIRRALGLSRRELAEKIGASRSAVDYWERGNYVPSPQYAQKIRALSTKEKPAGEVPLHKAKAITALEHAEKFRKNRQRNLVTDAIKYVADESQMAPGYLKAQITTFLAIVQDNQNLTLQEVLDSLSSS
jgi:transcriptional regulator with XRE-family HTH domain